MRDIIILARWGFRNDRGGMAAMLAVPAVLWVWAMVLEGFGL